MNFIYVTEKTWNADLGLRGQDTQASPKHKGGLLNLSFPAALRDLL
jgi:hypothetical protein